MELGQFSLSLAVKDIQASRDFYQKLGFLVLREFENDNWMILQQGQTVIGLFQGMFEENILTFNPSDVRDIQKQLKALDVPLLSEADETTNGPAHMMLKDPDGNTILLDQHATKPNNGNTEK